MNQQAVDQIKAQRDEALRERDGWKTEHDLLLSKLNATMEAQPEQACYCNADVSLQMVSGGGAPEGYLGKVTLRIGDQYRDYYTHPAQPSEPKAEPSKYPELRVFEKAEPSMGNSHGSKDEPARLTDDVLSEFAMSKFANRAARDNAILDEVIRLRREAEPARLTDAEIDKVRMSVGYAAGMLRFTEIVRAIESKIRGDV